MSLRKKFVASSLWSITASAFDSLSSLLTFIVLARLLTPVEFGTVAFAMVFIGISRVFVIAGIPDALIRQPEWNDNYASTAFWTNTAIGLTFAVGLSAGMAPAVIAYYDRTFGLVLATLSVTLAIEGLTAVHIAKLRKEFRHKMIARRGIASNLISSAIGISLAFAGWGVWAMVISRAVAVSTTSLILWRASDFRPRRHFAVEEFLEIVRFSRGVLGSQLLNQAGNQLPVVLLGSLIGPAAVAQYRVGFRPIELITNLIVSPIQSTAVSVLSSFGGDPKLIGTGYLRLTRNGAALLSPILFGIAAIAPDFVRVVFGPQWTVAGYVLMVLGLTAGSTILGAFEATVLNAAGRSDLTFYVSLVGSLGNIMAGFLGLRWGPIGVAAAIALRVHITIPVALYLIRSVTGVKPSRVVANILPPYISALIAFSSVWAAQLLLTLPYPEIVRMMIFLCLGGAAFFCILLLFFRSYVQELRAEFSSVLPQKPRR